MSEDRDSKPDNGGPATNAGRADGNETAKDMTADRSLGEVDARTLMETRIPAEWREWVRQQFNEEVFLRELKAVQANGGLAFEDFFDALLEEVRDGRDEA
jgi:hypothetical protein